MSILFMRAPGWSGQRLARCGTIYSKIPSSGRHQHQPDDHYTVELLAKFCERFHNIRIRPLPYYTPPLKKAIPRSLGSLFPQKPHSERTQTDSEYDVG